MPADSPTILASLLDMLGSGEKQRFRRWLLSENKGQQTQLVQLFDCWRDHAYQLPPNELLWQLLFPDLPEFDDLKIRRIKSRLLHQLKRFFSWLQLQQDDFATSLAFLEKCLFRQHVDLYHRFHLLAFRKLEKSKLRNAAYFKHRHDLLSLYQVYLFGTRQEIPSELMQDIFDSFELWHLHSLLFFAINSLDLQQSRSLKVKLPFDKHMLQKAESWEVKSDGKLPLLAFYLQVFLLNAQPEKGNFPLALNNFIKIKSVLPASEKQSSYRLLLNLVIRQYNQQANPTNSQNLLDILQLGIREGLIQDEKGILPSSMLKAIVEAALQARSPMEAEKYLDQYLNQLAKADQQEIKIFCQALILLHKGQFLALQAQLENQKFQSINDSIRSRFLLLQTAVELHPERLEEEILREAKALEKYLQRHELHLSQRLRKRYQKHIRWFIQFVERYFDPEALQKQAEAMEVDRDHSFIGWLLSHVKEQIRVNR